MIFKDTVVILKNAVMIFQDVVMILKDMGMILKDVDMILKDVDMILKDMGMILKDVDMILKDLVMIFKDTVVILKNAVMMLQDVGMILKDLVVICVWRMLGDSSVESWSHIPMSVSHGVWYQHFDLHWDEFPLGKRDTETLIEWLQESRLTGMRLHIRNERNNLTEDRIKTLLRIMIPHKQTTLRFVAMHLDESAMKVFAAIRDQLLVPKRVLYGTLLYQNRDAYTQGAF